MVEEKTQPSRMNLDIENLFSCLFFLCVFLLCRKRVAYMSLLMTPGLSSTPKFLILDKALYIIATLR